MAQKETNTLGAGVASPITLSGGRTRVFEVTHHADVTSVIYVRVDGTAATVAGDDCDVILPGERVQIIGNGTGTISLISSGAPTYTVSRLT